MPIIRTRKSFSTIVESSMIADGVHVAIHAIRAPFCRANYKVFFDETPDRSRLESAFHGPLHAASAYLDRIDSTGAMTDLLRQVAAQASDPAPYFEPPKAGKGEANSRFLTAKEIIILVALNNGVTTIGSISEVFGLRKIKVRIGLVELGSSGLVESPYDGGPKRFQLTEGGKKLLSKGGDEVPFRSCQEWLERRQAKVIEDQSDF